MSRLRTNLITNRMAQVITQPTISNGLVIWSISITLRIKLYVYDMVLLMEYGGAIFSGIVTANHSIEVR